MYPLEYYSRSKEAWLPNETQEVNKQYVDDLLDIQQIADIHKRSPGCISYKLKSLGIIGHNTMARGYAEYRASALYNEIVSSGVYKTKDKTSKVNKEKEKTKETNVPVKLSNIVKHIEDASLSEINSLKGEIHNMKSDIEEMKKYIKELLECMKAVYEFENA